MGGHTTFVRDLAEVGALDFSRDADERAPERVLRGCEQHLLLDFGVIGGPAVIRLRRRRTRARDPKSWRSARVHQINPLPTRPSPRNPLPLESQADIWAIATTRSRAIYIYNMTHHE